MKNSVIFYGALIFVLTACGSSPTKVDGGPSVPPQSTVPVNVTIVNGKIDAPEKTYTFSIHDSIQWSILNPPGTYTFPKNGIVFQKPGIFTCNPLQGGRATFICTKTGNQHIKGEYKYTINVDDGSKPLLPFDPFIDNQ